MHPPSTPPGLMTGPLCPVSPQLDQARLAVFVEAADRMRPFFDRHRAAEARRPKMPTETLEI